MVRLYAKMHKRSPSERTVDEVKNGTDFGATDAVFMYDFAPNSHKSLFSVELYLIVCTDLTGRGRLGDP